MKNFIALALVFFWACAHTQIGGTFDLSFNTTGYRLAAVGGGVSKARAIALLNDGSFLVTGSTYSNSTGEDVFVLKLDSVGALVTSFGTSGVAKVDVQTGSDDIAYSIVVDESTGNFFVGGSTNNGTKQSGMVLKFNSTGNLDNTFGSNGKAITSISGTNTETFFKIKFHAATGKVVAVGSSVINSASSKGAVVRYKANGALDSTFATNGISMLTGLGNNKDYLRDLHVFPNGKILAAGHSYRNHLNVLYGWVIQLNENGTADNAFGTSGQTLWDAHTYINAILYDNANSKIYIAGGHNSYFDGFNREIRVKLARVGTNGITDSWNASGTTSCCYYLGGYYEGEANAVAFSADGGFFMAGEGFDVGENIGFVSKAKSDGRPDLTFGTDPNDNDVLFGSANDNFKFFDMVIQPDNKIVVAGYSDNNFIVARLFGSTVPQLDSFRLVAPANNATEVPNETELRWTRAVGAEKYEVSFDTLSSFQTAKAFEISDSTAQAFMTNFEINKTYYWRVRAKNGNQAGAWKGSWMFSTVKDLITLLSPPNGATNVNAASAFFDWTDVTYFPSIVSQHMFQGEIAISSGFNGAVPLYVSMPQSNYTPFNPLATNTTYFWRVRTRRGIQFGPWSEVFSFTTTNPTSVSNIESNTPVVLFPNPAWSTIAVLSSKKIDDAAIQIFDIQGKAIPIDFVNGVADISHLASGFYFVQSAEKENQFRLRFVKE